MNKKPVRQPLQNALLRLEALVDKPFGPKWNPLRQMGTISFYLFWLVSFTGIYLYVLFDTHVPTAYQSVQDISAQWWLAGIMRSIHRYASDGMVLATLIHLTREFLFDRYRDARWFTWFTGVPIIWFLLFSGISGYWLVWDELAQYVAIASMEWIDWLGIFGEPIANNFLTEGSLTDRFFTLMMFMHIFAPLFLLFIMWIHILRINHAKINPPKGLALGILGMLLVLSLVFPATSQAPANLAIAPATVKLDWFYMAFYPVFEEYGGGPLWIVAALVSVFVMALPWIPPIKLPKAAVVDLEKCNGCTRCFVDCPFGAVQMQARTDGRPFEQEAVVDTSLCTACGICVGACPTSTPFRHSEELTTGIDLPDFPLKAMKAKTVKAMEAMDSEVASGDPRVLVYGCIHGADMSTIEEAGVKGIALNCISMLPPSFLDFALAKNATDGVVIVSCPSCDCFNRLGDRWLEERMDGARDPYLRRRVPRDRLLLTYAGRIEVDQLKTEVAEFREKLKALPAPEATAKPAKKASAPNPAEAPAEGGAS